MMLDKALLTAPPLQKTNVDGLSLLTSGPQAPNPADLLIGKTMETVIETLRNQAGYVIFDAPPVLAVTDAPLLASKLDGLLLVIKAGATLRDHAERAKEVLERAHVRILGAVLTNAPRDTAQGSY
jgi:capsular exopolysaccharide synthesis family protein